MSATPKSKAAGLGSVVIVDDSRSVLASAQAALTHAGFEVTTATDPEELDPQRLLEAKMIIVDVNMEQVFGDDVVHFLRYVWNVSAPIYLYSTIDEDELRARAEQSGANGAISKRGGSQALVAQALALARALDGGCA